ncbi:MAG: hypothetical protein IPO42_01130 [Chitinophagaceae bacterium]|nr:hypothetical protein [Chitinophagaceae bacterium]
MLHHNYLHSYDIDYSGNRNNNEQETYMLLQDTVNFTSTGKISIEGEMVTDQCTSNDEDAGMNPYE